MNYGSNSESSNLVPDSNNRNLRDIDPNDSGSISFFGLHNAPLEILKSYGIDVDFLSMNYVETPNRFLNLNYTLHGEKFVAQVLNYIRDGSISAIDPFFGTSISSVQMVAAPSQPWLVVPIYGYQFIVRDKSFYRLFAGHTGSSDLGFYFPEIQTFIYSPSANFVSLPGFVNDWLSYTRENFDCFPGVAPDSTKLKFTVIIGNGHFAHHYWNELSFVQALVDNDLCKNVKFVCRSQPIAALSEIFSEIQPGQVEICNVSFKELYHKLLVGNYFCIPAGRFFIPEELRHRVLEYSKKRHPEIYEQSQVLKKSYSHIFWIALRTDARTWLNQIDSIVRLLGEMHKRWPKMAFLIDGTSFSNDSGVRGFANMVSDEKAVLSKIRERLPLDIFLLDLIGLELSESFCWMQIVDFYLTPHGTIQHKVGWFTKIPGVVHCGENMRDDIVVKRHYATFSAAQGSTAPNYVFGKVIRDDTRDARKDMFSYELDWQDVFNELLKLAPLKHCRVNPN